jgi:hypothetical protein
VADSDSLPERKLFLDALAGVGAAIIGAVAWAIVTVSTKYQIGFMAIAIGALVGFALRIGNGGKAFGILGAFLALFGCVLGNYFSIIAFASAQQHVGFLTMLNHADPTKVVDLMWDDFLSASVLFYAITVYEGYRFSIVRAKTIGEKKA